MSDHTRFERRATTLRVSWGDGTHDDYPYIWLRMNSDDPVTRHPGTGQILISVADLDADSVTPTSVECHDQALHIAWPGVERPAAFSLSWLREHASNAHNRAARVNSAIFHLEPTPWLPDDVRDAPRFRYPELGGEDGERVLRALLEAFLRLGFVRLEAVPTQPGQVARVVAELGGYVRETNYGRTFQVVTEEQPSHLAYSSMALALHTDMGYRDCTPGIQLLHCLAACAEGGESTIADGARICADLFAQDPDAFAILAETPVSFRYRDADTELFEEKTLIQVHPEFGAAAGASSGKERIPRIDSFFFNERTLQPVVLASPDQVEAFYRAYGQLVALVHDPRYTLEFKMQPGDLLVFHNRRVLHGRRGYRAPEKSAGTSGPIRHLEGCYADLDGLASRYRVLARSAA